MAYNTIESIEKEIQDLELKRQELLKKKSELNELTPAQQLANVLHAKQCHWNHIDACGWDYSSWNAPCPTRIEYLKKAERILREVDLDTVVKVLNLI